MSRQEVGRAALRLLTSHVEHEESNEREHHYQSNQYNQHATNTTTTTHTSTTSPISSSYFGGNALQITDSPSSSPSLAATHFQRFDSFARTRSGYSRAGEGSSGTPGTSDVPSLSLSNSSFSDGPLRSPFSEHAPSQTSISSTRTVMQHVPDDEDHRRHVVMPEATIRRVASNLQLSIDDVRRVERCMSQDSKVEKVQENILMEDLGRERFHRIVDAVRAEEERLSQLSSFRSAYLRAETEAASQRRQHASIPLPLPTRTTAPTTSSSSPPPCYEQLDFMDHRSGPIPSPRAALESLTGQSSQYSHSPHSPLQGFEQSFSRASPHRNSYWNTSTSPYHTHTRQTSSGSRPISLPDRSYRSMDDYTHSQPSHIITSPLLRGESRLSIRRSIHGLMSSPNPPQTNSRQASRSPLIESPRLLEDDDMEETEEKDYVYSSSNQASYQQYLRPGPSPSLQARQRSASSNEYDTHPSLSKASRRASAEVLGQSFKKASSPFQTHDKYGSNTINESSGSSTPSVSISTSQQQSLSHEEVMARLQRKVKERLAAKNAGLDYTSSNVIVGGRSKSVREAKSPVMSKHSSLPYGTQPSSLGSRSGRRRQESLASQFPPSSSKRSSSKNGRTKQIKSPSLKGLVQEMERREEDNKEDEKMEDVAMSVDSNGTAGMGIEALLSAAAIADSPYRANYD